MAIFGGKKPTIFGGMGEGTLAPMTNQPNNMPQMPELKAKPSFFGEGGAGRGIAGAIGDFLLQRSGMQPMYAPVMQQRQQQALLMKQRDQQRSQEWEDWQRKQEWERANPSPVNNDTINDFNWFKTLSPEDRALYGQMKPQYITADNGDGTKTIVPVTPGMFGGQQPAAPTAPVGKLRPIGGGSGGNVGGGFRPGY